MTDHEHETGHTADVWEARKRRDIADGLGHRTRVLKRHSDAKGATPNEDH